MKKKNFWIAVNGPSVTASDSALPESLAVIPVPEQLLGFETKDEQLFALAFLLNAPADAVSNFMNSVVPDAVAAGEIVHKKLSNPDEPGPGTLWMSPPRNNPHIKSLQEFLAGGEA